MNYNTILITGGATGIGFSMAKYFHERDNTVIICGRQEDRLAQATEILWGVRTIKCDVANMSDRNALFKYIRDNFPEINILVNNAGVQHDIDLTKGVADMDNGVNEIRVNLEAPIYLSALFTPLLSGKDNAAIVNVSSDLAFMPEHAVAVGMPVYCATKAGLHTFTMAQRRQLAPLNIRAIEIIPPLVESKLNIEGRKKRNMMKSPSPHMISSDEFVEKALAKMEQGADEIRFGAAS